MGERVTKVMPPPVMGKDVPLSKIFDKGHARYGEGGEFRALYQSDPDVARVVDTAKGISLPFWIKPSGRSEPFSTHIIQTLPHHQDHLLDRYTIGALAWRRALLARETPRM